MTDGKVQVITQDEGGEATIAAMNEYSRAEIGRKTLRFVRHLKRDPEIWAKIQARAAEIRAANAT